MQQFNCPRCGAPVIYGAQYCSYCGLVLNWGPPVRPVPAYPAEPPEKKTNPLVVALAAMILIALAAVGSCAVCTLIPSKSTETIPSIQPKPTTQPSSQSTPQSSQSSQSPPSQSTPQVIKQWTGSGIKTTEPFTIIKNQWQIRWSSNPEMVGDEAIGIFQIFVYSETSSNIPVAFAANTSKKETGTDFVYKKGTFSGLYT